MLDVKIVRVFQSVEIDKLLFNDSRWISKEDRKEDYD